MNIIILILILSIWIVGAVIDYSHFTYIWQLKEYRLDKFKDFLSTKKGQAFIRGYYVLWRPIGIIAIYTFLRETFSTYAWLIGIVLFVDVVYNAILFFQKKRRRPVITKKTILLIGTSIIFEIVCYIITGSLITALFFLVFRFMILSGIVVGLGYPTEWVKKIYIYMATKKMKQYDHLRIIGVTGSYGKTSVKTFLGQILQKNFRVVTTPKNINTEIGVAQFILRTDFNKYDVFVVEMGAYREGEIKLICNIVQPSIGVLTAINEQHLSLFGSIKHTQKAKYELLRCLPQDGLAVTNSDNPYCREYLDQLKSTVETFGCDETYHPTFQIKHVGRSNDGISFKASYKDVSYEVDASVIGEHNATNIAPAIIIARFLGMEKQDIILQCESLVAPERSLEVYAYGKATIVDDSYNANPDGFKAALHYLSSFPTSKKRILITRGMVELGEKSASIHKRIGEEISFVVDELVIISKDEENALREGIHKKYRTNILTRYNPRELLLYVKALKDEDVVILIENRIPSLVYKELKS